MTCFAVTIESTWFFFEVLAFAMIVVQDFFFVLAAQGTKDLQVSISLYFVFLSVVSLLYSADLYI